MKRKSIMVKSIIAAIILILLYLLICAITSPKTTETAKEFYYVVGEGDDGRAALREGDWIPKEILEYTAPYEDPSSYPGNVLEMIYIEKVTKDKIYVREVEWNPRDPNAPNGFSIHETGVEKEYTYDSNIEIWMNANIYQYRISLKDWKEYMKERKKYTKRTRGIGPYRYSVEDGVLKGVYEQYLP